MGSKILAICITLLGISLLSTSFAQEEEVEYSWGTVKSISSTQIVVTEYDYDNDEDVEVAYSIDPKVELRGVKILKDIAAGDNLDIEYIIKDGKKVAKVISVEKAPKAEEEEEYSPSQSYEDEWEYPMEESGSTETSEPDFE